MNVTIAICGGGACGLAVLLSLLDLSKDRQRCRAIYIFEPRPQVGPGLAYSESYWQTIINMRADTMGLRASDPLHFSRWLRKTYPHLQNDAYPSRQVYGLYLQELLEAAYKEAEAQGVHFEVVRQEIVAISQRDEKFEVVDDSHRALIVDKVVLALGNFMACSQIHLQGRPGYFQNPWPLQKLDVIDRKSSVCILGSRLSGIDAAVRIADQGHEGLLLLVSRGGRLPKVQGRRAAKPYTNQYALHIMARGLEESRVEPSSLENLFNEFKPHAEQLGLTNWPDFLRKKDPLSQLSLDIKDAEQGESRWRLLPDAAAPIFELLWDTLPVQDKITFLERWNSLWYTYVHAMPYDNALRLQSLLQEGRVVVADLIDIHPSSSGFDIHTSMHRFHADYVVEATGLETQIPNIPSRLIQSLQSSKLLIAHPAGGFSVDRHTFEASTKGMYVVGSLTSGVHFYTNGIDRNVVHALRISRHILTLPVQLWTHIALILPHDQHMWSYFLEAAIPALLARDFVPFVYMAKLKGVAAHDGISSKNTSLFGPPPDVLAGCTQHDDNIQSSSRSEELWTSLCKNFGVSVHICDVLNDEFSNLLTEHRIDVGLAPVDVQGCHTVFGSMFEHRYVVTDPPFCVTRRLQRDGTAAVAAWVEQNAVDVVLPLLHDPGKP